MRPDVLIIGGGLAAGLTAVAITQRRPGTSVMILERGATLGGNHIWSFFQSDIAAEDWSLVAPFVTHRWDGSEVAFPGLRRALPGAYCAIESERFDAVLRTMLPSESIRAGANVMALDRGGVMLAGGERIEAEAVIEARGLRDISALDLGWQKFAGRLLKLQHPHGLDRPTIMDATVDQSEGYRFVYVLPFGPDRVFVEDTYYSTDPDFDEAALETRILDYARTCGWQVEGIARREAAALPIAKGGNFELLWRSGAQGIGKIGMAAALFHPLTGYSLPDAVRTAGLIAGLKSLYAEPLHDALRKHAEARWNERRYYRLLAKLMFEAAAPMERWRMLARFYALKPDLIARFYAAQSTWADKARILCGKPPVPIGQAIKVISGGHIVTKHVAVIGAGFGGLALAIRLQSAGVATTIVEARDKPGGRAYFWEKDGFTFDAGPTVITDPNCLQELWALSGGSIDRDVTLLSVSPFYRLNWSDGVSFDYSNDEPHLRSEIARLNPADVAGYAHFLDYAAGVYHEGYEKLGHVAFLDFASMIKAAPSLARYQAWRSVYSVVSSYVKDEHLRQALSFHTLLVGGNPMNTSAIYALIHKLEKAGGVWFAKGGTNRLIAGMVALFERLGGTLRLGDAVAEIETRGDRVTGVRTESGWRGDFDAVASNADVVHSYRDLLSNSGRGRRAAKAVLKKRFSPSLFLVHFGIKGTWHGIPHHMILFGPRYAGLLKDIYDHGVLPADFSLYLHHPSVTDPGMAPEGCSTFYALAPVPHLGKAPLDWEAIQAGYADRILEEIERRLIPGLRERLVTRFHYTPLDFESDLHAHLGSAFSLEPILTQSAWFRTHNRDDAIPNLYFVGAGTHPGAGIPGVVGSAKATAKLMLEDLA